MILVMLLFLLTYCKEEPKEIHFPEGLQTMSLNDSLAFDPQWYQAEYKLVTYMGGRTLPLWLDWDSYIKEFPEVAFVFYFTSKDTASLFKELEKNNFYHPFVLDPENVFFTTNELENVKLKQHNFIPLTVKGNAIVEIAEVGMPNLFRKDMRNLLGRNRND